MRKSTRLALFILLSAALAGCKANMQLSGTVTDRGVINRSNLDLGQVYIWNRAEGSSNRVYTIDSERAQLTRATAPVNSSVNFLRSASFIGGVDLSAEQKATLEAEVGSRSSVISTELSTQGFRAPVNTLIESVRANPDEWYQRLGLERDGDLLLPANTYLILVQDVSKGQSLNVKVDRELATRNAFTSNTIRMASGNLRFRIVDAAHLQFVARDEPAVLFANLSVYTTHRASNGLGFRRVVDAHLMDDLADTFISGR